MGSNIKIFFALMLQSSMVAILFADTTEASNFREALDGKLEAKRQRRNGMRIVFNNYFRFHGEQFLIVAAKKLITLIYIVCRARN